MGMQLVERWEGAGKGAKYQIDVERFEPSSGREFFNIRLLRNSKAYENTLARSPIQARDRIQHVVDWGLAFGTSTYKRTFRDEKLAPRAHDDGLQIAVVPNRFQLTAKLAMFLTTRAGSCTARWEGRMLADAQRALFGRFLGKGTLIIDGATERIKHYVSRGFGLDYEYTADLRWTDL